MIEYYAVLVPTYFFDQQITNGTEFHFEDRGEAEQFATDVDKHRHGVELFDDIREKEEHLNAYFVNQGAVVLKKVVNEVITTYEGI